MHRDSHLCILISFYVINLRGTWPAWQLPGSPAAACVTHSGTNPPTKRCRYWADLYQPQQEFVRALARLMQAVGTSGKKIRRPPSPPRSRDWRYRSNPPPRHHEHPGIAILRVSAVPDVILQLNYR